MAPPSGLYLSRRTQTGSVHCLPIVAQMHHFFWRARAVFAVPLPHLSARLPTPSANSGSFQ